MKIMIWTWHLLHMLYYTMLVPRPAVCFYANSTRPSATASCADIHQVGHHQSKLLRPGHWAPQNLGKQRARITTHNPVETAKLGRPPRMKSLMECTPAPRLKTCEQQ